MSKITKRLLSLLVVITMVLAMVPATGLPAVEVKAEATSAIPAEAQAQINKGAEIAALDPAAVVAGTTCPMCGATDIKWSKITTSRYDEAKVSETSVHYYVTGAVAPSNKYGWITTNDINNGQNGSGSTICVVLLNDAVVTSTLAPFRITGSGNTLNVMGNGSVTTDGSAIYQVDGMFYTDSDSTINLYGGTYTYTGTSGAPVINHNNKGATVNLYNDATINGAGVTRGIAVGANTTLNMYGGTITGGKHVNYGGNIYVNAGTANIYAGTVSNGTAQGSHGSEGGNLAVLGGTANIYGGNFVGGVATNGGNVAFPVYDYNGNNVGGTLNMQGGTFDGGTATANGGNLYTRSDFTIGENAVLKNGSAACGGNVYIWSAKLTTSGDLLNGSATGGGGNVYLNGSASMEVNGGSIGGGTTTGGFGPNIRISGHTVTINDGYIYGVDGSSYGGTIYAASGTLNINGGYVTSGIQVDTGAFNLSGTPQILKSITLPDGTAVTSSRGINSAVLMNADGLEKGANVYIQVNNQSADVTFATSTKAAEITGCFSNAWGGYIVADGNNLITTVNKPVVKYDCPACGAEDVEWTEFNGTTAFGGAYEPLTTHKHIYLKQDTTWNAGTNIAVLGEGGNICFDLNGKTLTVTRGRFWLGSAAANSVLNIFANGGKINYSNQDLDLIQANTGTVNIVGGTYSAVDTEHAMASAGGAFVLKDATVNATLADRGAATAFKLEGSTVVSKVNLDNGGKLELASDWTGEATLDMEASELTSNVVDKSVVYYTGDAPSGKLKLASGEELAYEGGAVRLPRETMEADCSVCKTSVTWTEFDGSAITVAEDEHAHYYLAADVDTTVLGDAAPANIITLSGLSKKLCLNLNGHTLTTGSAIVVDAENDGGGVVMNIIGNGGEYIYTASRSDKGIYMHRGGGSIRGGTYTYAPAEGKSGTLMLFSRSQAIYDATINGTVAFNSAHANVTLRGTTTVTEIDYTLNAGKITLGADWTGSIGVKLPEGASVADHVICQDGATGTVTLSTGETFMAYKGTLIPARATTCSACGEENVTWEIYDGTKVYGDAYNPTTENHHLYLVNDVTYSNASGNAAVVGAGVKLCLDLNGKTLTMNGSRLWAKGEINVIANGGTVDHTGRIVAQTDAGATVNLIGGTYTGFEQVVTLSGGTVVLKDVTTTANLVNGSWSSVIKLQGETNVGKITLDYASPTDANPDRILWGKLELDSSWTGEATLDLEASELTNNKVDKAVAYYTGAAPSGTLKLASGEEIVFAVGALYVAQEVEVDSKLPADAQQKIKDAAKIAMLDPADVIASSNCPMCGATDVTWKKQSGRMDMAEGQVAHVYITGEMTQESFGCYMLYNVNDNTPVHNVKICTVLVDANVNTYGPFIAAGASTGSVINVMGTGTVNSTGTKASGSYGTVCALSTSTINLYGGTYTYSGARVNYANTVLMSRDGANVNVFDGVVIGNETQDRDVPSVAVSAISGTVNMYGGTVRNSTAANVLLYDNSVFNMYAGTVENGYNPSRGGNIATSTFNGGRATMNIYGGTIKDGEALRGGNIGNQTGNLNIYGGTITGGVAAATIETDGYGGNIYVSGEGTVHTISGGSITNGSATMYGGNIYALRGVTTISGATISGGTAETFGGDYYVTNKNGAQLIFNGGDYTGANIGIEGYAEFRDATVDTILCADGHDVRLHGTTTVNSIDVAETMGAVRGMSDWTGTANLNNIHESTFVKGVAQNATADRYILVQSKTSYANGGRLLVDGYELSKMEDADGNKNYGALCLAAVKVTNKGTTWYTTVAGALAEYTAADFAAGNYLIINAFGESVVLNGANYYIDAAGHAMAVSGSGKLYAMDSDNAEDFEGFGEWTVADGVEIVRDFTAADGTRYLVITESGVTSAHALVMDLSGVTVNTDEAGLYYEAQYKCDDALAAKISSYGVIASLKDMPGATMEAGDARTELHTFQPDWNHEVLSNSSYVYGIFKNERTAAQNAKFGKMDIYANPYIQLNVDGTGDVVFVGQETGDKVLSLYDALKYINDNWSMFSGDDRDAVNAFYTTWANKGMSEYAADLGNIVAKTASPVETPLTWATINQNAGNSANMSGAERRAEALRFMNEMMSFAWTPNVETDHYNNKGEGDYFIRTYEVGTVYGGTPYVTNTQGNLYTMMEYYDEKTGILDLTGGMDTIKMFSNQCSGSVYWAWQRVAPSAKFDSTATMVAANGCLPVGPYTYDTSIANFYQMGLTGDNGNARATDYIIEQNGVQTMYESYALVQPGDGLVTFIDGNNHARMVSGTAKVVRNPLNNEILGSLSTLTYIDQSGVMEQTKEQGNGVDINLIGDHNVVKTFADLIEEGYIPFTFAEFEDGAVVEASQVTLTVEGNTVADLANAVVSSNYGISDITYVVKDAQGNEVYRDLFVTFPVYGLHNYQFRLGAGAGMLDADALAFFADGNHTIEISVRIGSGEKPVVYTGTLAG